MTSGYLANPPLQWFVLLLELVTLVPLVTGHLTDPISWLQMEECKAPSSFLVVVGADSSFSRLPSSCDSPRACPFPFDPLFADGILSPGVWAPFAVETSLKRYYVLPEEVQLDFMQVHLVIPNRVAGFILDRNGHRIQTAASTSVCKVWMTSSNGSQAWRVVVIGNYKQGKVTQPIAHVLMVAMQVDWQVAQADVILFMRSEVAGKVTDEQDLVTSFHAVLLP